MKIWEHRNGSLVVFEAKDSSIKSIKYCDVSLYWTSRLIEISNSWRNDSPSAVSYNNSYLRSLIDNRQENPLVRWEVCSQLLPSGIRIFYEKHVRHRFIEIHIENTVMSENNIIVCKHFPIFNFVINPSLQIGLPVEILVRWVKYGARYRYCVEPDLPLHHLAIPLHKTHIVHLSVCALESAHCIIICWKFPCNEGDIHGAALVLKFLYIRQELHLDILERKDIDELHLVDHLIGEKPLQKLQIP